MNQSAYRTCLALTLDVRRCGFVHEELGKEKNKVCSCPLQLTDLFSIRELYVIIIVRIISVAQMLSTV